MRKRIITPVQQKAPAFDQQWLNIEEIAVVEITSEDAKHPIEAAFQSGESGWRASSTGEQTIRIRFDNPQKIQRIRIDFSEPSIERTQEFSLAWMPEGEKSYRQVVRQQWNFSPSGATREVEDLDVDLTSVDLIELTSRRTSAVGMRTLPWRGFSLHNGL
ncbi:MAG: hypothetical protein WA632_01870 [Gallionella sp.]